MNDFSASRTDQAARDIDVTLRPEQRRSAAYHEAAHAVVGYWFGWGLSDDGIRIGDWDYCGHRLELARYTEQADICVSLAGWLAETLLYPSLVHRHPDSELRTILTWALEGDEFSADNSDEYRVFRRLIEERQTQDEGTLLTIFHAYEIEALKLLVSPVIWRSIERIAEALLEQEQLSDGEAMALLSWGIYTGKVLDAESESDV